MYSTIESIVELEIQKDDANKENEIDEERKGYQTSFKNTKLPVTKECYQIILSLDLIFFAEGSLNMLQDFKTLFWSNIPIFSNEKSEIFENFV